MSFNRFCFLHANICFDNPDTKKELLQHDRFIPIRDTFEKCYKQCSLIINPQDYLSLDETLVPMQNRNCC